MAEEKPLVGILMGSKSDWEAMKSASEALARFGVPHECRVLSAHRTPGATVEYVGAAEARGIEVMIAAAGGAAHLPGILAPQPRHAPAASNRLRSTRNPSRSTRRPRQPGQCVFSQLRTTPGRFPA